MTSYIIIDDEPIAHRIIEGYCKDLPHLQLKGHCYDALEAMDFLSKQSVDLMFLDLNMPKLKGFEFLKTLKNPPKVIVTTAYKEFALEGYELDVVDYLLKPFSFERLVKAVNKVTSSLQSDTSTSTVVTPRQQRLFLKGDKKYHQILLDDILYIEAYGNYTKVILPGEKIITHEKISSYEELLSPDKFLRVHKSFIVSIDHIQEIEGNRIHIGDYEIPIGQVYKMGVTRLLS